MFPLYDENPSRGRPWVTWSLITLNVLTFLWEINVTKGFSDIKRYMTMIYTFGVTPALLMPYPILLNPFKLYTLLTSQFLHADFGHIFGNMLFLFIFGDNVEDRFGRVRFLTLYLLFGVVAGLLHTVITVLSPGMDPRIPAIGASGAVSGILGSYLALFPRARVVTLVFFFYFIRLVRIPALYYLGFWFLYQVYYGMLGVTGVAFWAHIGGFMAGLLVGLLYKAFGWGPYKKWGAYLSNSSPTLASSYHTLFCCRWV